ncbi:MAG TPA: hypothetical protein VGZ32_12600 [Actinocrinis sp.]|uniref:hypothetical protein n=1 Tax=Actinocrinis sp. TaxID=1920516 RepID=UPI002DDD2DAF|nr:hypothetical protein [Actinocrinis sp.]HEV3171180.1 hypothetical protein [Actinocrinis sp.]
MRIRRPRLRRLTFLVSALLAVAALVAAASCSATAQDQSPAAAQRTTDPPTAICGAPPCDKYLTRGETRTVDHAISGHPIATAIALHLVVSAFCGGVLCIWGEGFSFVYVQHEAHVAAQNDECLRVHVLPQGHQWQLVNLDASNQSPYCTG